MRKKLDVFRHIGVLLFTILIFTIGTLIGGEVEQLRVQNLYTQLQEQDLNYQNIVTESRYLDYIIDLEQNKTEETCDSLKGAYYTSITNLDDSRLKLEEYINSAKASEEEYFRLKDHYANLQIDYWILANKISNYCGNVQTILYFYGEKKKCPACEDQGVHLSYVKQKLQDDILIFALDYEKEGATSLLNQRYEVKYRELPVIVIDEEIFGYKKNEEVFDILCKKGLKSEEICG